MNINDLQRNDKEEYNESKYGFYVEKEILIFV